MTAAVSDQGNYKEVGHKGKIGAIDWSLDLCDWGFSSHFPTSCHRLPFATNWGIQIFPT